MVRLALLLSFLGGALSAQSNPFIRSAREMTTPRHLDEEEDISWMSKYTLKYDNCFASSKMATFRLCPEGNSCESGCEGGGEYLVSLPTFIDAFTEAQMNAHEYICEQVRENCEYDDDATCYQNAGLNYCQDNDSNEDDFNVQEYLECKEMDDDYYVGPYCSSDDAYSIYLGLFEDEDCTEAADVDFYETFGYELPYSSESILSNECAKCREHGQEEHQNDEDQEDDDDVLEQCEELYQEASKCEQDMDISNADSSACATIETMVEEEEAIESSSYFAVDNGSRGSGGSWMNRRIWFALFIALVAIGVIGACLLIGKKRERSKERDYLTDRPAVSKENLI